MSTASDSAVAIHDRRQRRSDSAGDAGQLLLAAHCRRIGASAMVLADEHGLLIAGAQADGASFELDVLAAMSVTRGPWERAFVDVSVVDVPLGESDARLLTVGSSQRLSETAVGLRRIFG